MKVTKLNILLFPILFLSCWISSAQGGWKNKYYLANSLTSECRDVLEAPNGNIIMAGITVDSAGNKLTMIGTDYQGTILWRRDYGNTKFQYLDNYTHMGRGLLKEGNYFYQVSCVKDSNSRNIGVLLKFNFNGDTLWQRIYRDSDSLEDVVPQGLCRSVDGGLLITGYFQNSGASPYRKALLIKTDLNGKELWRKKIGKNPPDMVEVQDGKSIVQDSLTKKIVITGYQYLGASYANYGNVLILDSLGNKLVQTTYNNWNGGPFYQVIQTKDKNFLTCGGLNSFKDQFGSIIRYYGFLAKFDISGNLIWSKTYDTISRFRMIGRIHELSNGDIVTAGHIDTMLNYPELGTGARTRIQLYRLDSNGNVKFKKNVGSVYKEDDDEYIRSMNACQDGGYVIAAWKIHDNPVHPYDVIRVDSNFCDTLEAWCKSVALGMDELEQGQFAALRVFPNPASDLVNIGFNAAYSDERSYSIRISDISGRELEKRSIQSQEKLTLNTDQYPSGVYFVSLMQNGKAVTQRKLIIAK